MEKNLGHATAYGYAKSKGYSGTEDEFAQLMADYASVGQSAAQSAEQAAASATSASGSATTAASAAQTATSKALEAVTAADTATTKASEANQSASTASAAATSAGTSAQTATTAATTATTKASEAAASEAAALSAKSDAESARDAAAQSASEASESARTLTIDDTLTRAGQAADAKTVGDAIDSLKSALESTNDINSVGKTTSDILNGYWSTVDGSFISGTSTLSASNKIPVVPGDIISVDQGIVTGASYFVFFGKTGNHVSHSEYKRATVPASACYAAIDILTSLGLTSIEISVKTPIAAANDDTAAETSRINDIIDNLQEKPYTLTLCDYTYNTSYYIQSDGTVSSIGDDKYCVSSGIDVTGIQNVFINASVDYSNCLYAFYDSNGAVVGKRTTDSGSTVTYFSDFVSVPNGAATLRVSYKVSASGDTPPSLALYPEYYNINLDDIITEKWRIVSGTTETGKYLNYDGVVGDFTGASLLTVDVTPGERIKVIGESWGINYYYSFFDANDDFISGGHGAGSAFVVYTDIATVPDGAVKVCVSSHGNVEQCVYDVDGYKIIPKWTGKKWVCIGDSLTEANSRTTKHYHDYIAEKTGITVVNMGDSGSGYMNEQDLGTAFYQRAANIPLDADVYTIFGSGNDLSHTLGTPTDTGTTTICGCINETIDVLIGLKPTIQLGIVAPTPWENYPPYTANNAMAQYVEALQTICSNRSIPFLDLYHCSNLRPWTSEGRAACYTKDNGGGVHPDETGHKIIAPRFEDFLDSLILS